MKWESDDTVVLFGGSFDPPHRGHITLPTLAMQAIDADHLAFIPAASQPLKAHRKQTPVEHRLAMLRLALADVKQASILTLEIDRAKANPDRPSYTVDTLEALCSQNPGCRFRLLIGADNLRVFDRWRHPDRIIELAEPLVMLRPPDDRASLLASLPSGYDANAWNDRIVDLPRIDISSTEIRQRVAAGEPVDEWVHPKVATYIIEQQLYQAGREDR